MTVIPVMVRPVNPGHCFVPSGMTPAGVHPQLPAACPVVAPTFIPPNIRDYRISGIPGKVFFVGLAAGSWYLYSHRVDYDWFNELYFRENPLLPYVDGFWTPVATTVGGWLGVKGINRLIDGLQNRHMAGTIFRELTVPNNDVFAANVPLLRNYISGLERHRQPVLTRVQVKIGGIQDLGQRDTVFSRFNRLLHPANYLPGVVLNPVLDPGLAVKAPVSLPEINGTNLVKWTMSNPRLASYILRKGFPSPRKIFRYQAQLFLQECALAWPRAEYDSLKGLTTWAIDACRFAPEQKEDGDELLNSARQVLTTLSHNLVISNLHLMSRYNAIFGGLAAICLPLDEDKEIVYTRDDIDAIRKLMGEPGNPEKPGSPNFTLPEKGEILENLLQTEARMVGGDASGSGAGAPSGAPAGTTRAKGKG